MMRTLHLAALFTLLASSAVVAQVPNGGFEQWTSFGTYEDPNGWTSLNALTTNFGGVLSCEQAVPAAAGSYGVKVTTREVPGFGIFPGLLLCGDPEAPADGFPYTSRPQAMTGKWKAAIGAGDQGAVVVTLTRWNSALGEREDVGAGIVTVTGTVGAWTPFTAVIQYTSTMDPDTASIAILSSSGLTGDAVAGSTVSVDDLAFGGATSIGEAYTGLVQLYPIPVVDVLNVMTDIPVQSIELWSADGRLALTARPGTDRVEIDLSGMSAGAYTLVARMADATVLRRTVVK